MTSSVVGSLLVTIDLLSLQLNTPVLPPSLPQVSVSTVHNPLPPKELLKRAIEQYSEEHGVDSNHLIAVANCESGLRFSVYGDKGKAFGPFQFWRGTFNQFKEEAGMPELTYEDPIAQSKLAAWSFANGKESHWTCDKIVKKATNAP